jgi:hypothetical protein
MTRKNAFRLTHLGEIQATYDLKKAAQNRQLMAYVARIVPLHPFERGIPTHSIRNRYMI